MDEYFLSSYVSSVLYPTFKCLKHESDQLTPSGTTKTSNTTSMPHTCCHGLWLRHVDSFIFQHSAFYLCLMIATILRTTQHLYFVYYVLFKNKHNSVAITKQNWPHTPVKENGLVPKTLCSLFRTIRRTRSRHTTIWSVTPCTPTVQHLEK